jgi:hypothetical protein
MKNIKLHTSPHPAESAVACPEVRDAEGDSRGLAGRCSSNLSRQNMRRPAAGRRRPEAPPAAGQGRPAMPPALPRPPSYSPLLLLSQLPPTIFVQKPAIKSKQISTYVQGSAHSIGIEPICGQRNTYITSLFGFLTVNGIKVFPCFTIGCMHHLVRIVSFSIFVPCHLFCGLLCHVQTLDPRYERKVS